MGRIQHRLLLTKPFSRWAKLGRKSSGRARALPLLIVAALALFSVIGMSFALRGQDTRSVGAADIVSVQSGTVTLPTGGGGTQTVNVPIAPVATASSVLFFNYRGASTDPDDGQVRGQLTSASNIQFFRADDTSVTDLTVQWYLAEFSSGVSVQRGTFSSVDATGDIAIAPVDLSSSFVLVSGSVLTGEDEYGSESFFRARLTSPANLEITHTAKASKTADWQVVDFAGATVQRGTGSITGAQTSATVPINSVDLSRSIVLLSWRTSIPGTGANFLRGRLTSPAAITIDRADGVSGVIEYAWEVVEFSNGTTVQSGDLGFGPADLSLAASLNAVDTGRAVPILSTAGGGWGGSHAYSDDDDIGPGMFTTWITGTALTASRQTGS